MHNLLKIGKRALALTLTMCLSIGACPTAGISKKIQKVEAAETTGFTSNDFLKVD